jgi:hypothetical protein
MKWKLKIYRQRIETAWVTVSANNKWDAIEQALLQASNKKIKYLPESVVVRHNVECDDTCPTICF